MRTPRGVRGGQGIRRDPGQHVTFARITVRPLAVPWRVLGWTLAFLVAWTLATASVFAQLPLTRVHSVFPAGGQVGTTFDLTVTKGDDLDELGRLLFNHPGIVATAKTQPGPNGQPELIPNQFTVAIAADVPLGVYELRAVGLYGISHPRMFQVGTAKEIVETEVNNTREQATAVDPGQTINGRVNGATDVDFYKFAGTAGQRLVFDCQAQRIDSKLDAIVELQDANGRRLASARGTTQRDAVLDVTLPAAGDYFLRVTDFIYAGGEDLFYRLSLRTAPYVDVIIPPAGVAGSTATYTLYGRNLPNGQPTDVVLNGRPLQQQTVEITLPADGTSWPTGLRVEPFGTGSDAFPFTLASPQGPANTVSLGFAASPVVMETEPNNLPPQVLKIAVPGEYAGAFQAKGDVDLYQFEAKAGEVVWIDVLGQRLGTGSDPHLTIDQVTVNDKGEETLKRITAVDDEPTNLLPIVFETQHDDPVVKFAAPADGIYRLALRDRYGASRGSIGLQYRLTLRREQPDFRVAVITEYPQAAGVKNPQPGSVVLRQGDQVLAWVVVYRRDGFEGDVDIVVEGLPAGVTCRDISVGTKPSQGLLVFESTEDAAPWAGVVKVLGKAKISDPVAAAAVTTAAAAIKPLTDAVTATTAAVAKPAAELQQGQTELAAAQQELAAKPDDEALKQKVAAAEAKVTSLKQAHDAAVAAKTAADQKLAEGQAALATAEQAKQAATKDYQREARYATMAIGGNGNVPGRPRLTDGLELAVLGEKAPFQVKTDVHRVIANHGRQILVPVKAIRRDGFDADIAMTFVGQPQNVQIENKPIKKGAPEEVYRVFVPANAPVGTYVLHLMAQAQVSYRRNPQKADRLKAEFDATDKAAIAAVEAQKAATTKRDEAVKQATVLQEELKKATEAKAAADKALVDAQVAEKTAADGVTNAGEDATKKAEAEKLLADAQAVTKTAQENVTKAEAARVDAEAKAKAGEEAKTTAETEFKTADEAVKTTAAAKTAAEQRFKQADDAAKAKNLNFTPPTTPIVLTIKPAPCTVAVAPANGGNLKRGEKVEVKVTITRQNNFTGPVTVGLDLPPGVVGLTAAPVTIAADQTEGTLVVEANGEATMGAIANLVVRAAAKFDGDALVDQPLPITVAQ